MSTIVTTPFPLLKDEELLCASNTNRIASALQPDFAFQYGSLRSTCWGDDPTPSSRVAENTLETMFVLYMGVFVRVLKAKANDEITRPIALYGQAWQKSNEIQCRAWFVQEGGQINRLRAITAEQPVEDNQPQPEFTWSKALYKARKAAQEFSKETHADY